MADAILPVTAGASIAGRVVDGTGAPVAGIGVMASEISRGERTTIRNGAITSGVQALTDARGAYKLIGLAAGAYRISALDRGRPIQLRSAPPTVELAASERKTGVDLAIDRPGGVITGVVTGAGGKPVADAWVSAQQDLLGMFGGGETGRGPRTPGGPTPGGMRTFVVENADGPSAETGFPPALTDAEGRYTLRGLPPATYTVIAEAQRGQLRARAVGITPDATVDLRIAPVTALSGTVTSPAGPVKLFSVELDGPTRTQRSFTDGAFAFDRVDPGSYTVRVQSSDGNGEAKVEVTADAPAAVAIALAANAVVIGKLVDASGAPLAGQPVLLTPDHGDGRLEVRMEGMPPTTGPDGSFRIEHRAEPCALMVMRPPRPFSRRGIVLTAGQTLDLGAVVVDSPDAPPGPGPGGGSGQRRAPAAPRAVEQVPRTASR
jgi:protocatechuate 3,4-dioxygenase beta subunit